MSFLYVESSFLYNIYIYIERENYENEKNMHAFFIKIYFWK